MNGAAPTQEIDDSTGVTAIQIHPATKGSKRKIRFSEIFLEYVLDAILVASLAVYIFVNT